MNGYLGTELALLVVAAVLVGFAKTAISGISAISVAIFAAVMPARESTGVLLPLLLVGDAFAVAAYREHARWQTLLRLMPAVAVGVIAGAAFVAAVDDTVMRRTIGIVLLLLVAVNLWTRARARRAARSQQEWATDPPPAALEEPERLQQPERLDPPAAPWRRRGAAGTYGSLAGFTTMVANAGGPVMSLYMLTMRLPMLAFLGTGASFFALVNVVKLPFSIGLGLISWRSLILDATLVPAVVVGALAGRRAIRHIDEALFERLVIAFTVLSALNLVR